MKTETILTLILSILIVTIGSLIYVGWVTSPNPIELPPGTHSKPTKPVFLGNERFNIYKIQKDVITTETKEQQVHNLENYTEEITFPLAALEEYYVEDIIDDVDLKDLNLKEYDTENYRCSKERYEWHNDGCEHYDDCQTYEEFLKEEDCKKGKEGTEQSIIKKEIINSPNVRNIDGLLKNLANNPQTVKIKLTIQNDTITYEDTEVNVTKDKEVLAYEEINGKVVLDKETINLNVQWLNAEKNCIEHDCPEGWDQSYTACSNGYKRISSCVRWSHEDYIIERIF